MNDQSFATTPSEARRPRGRAARSRPVITALALALACVALSPARPCHALTVLAQEGSPVRWAPGASGASAVLRAGRDFATDEEWDKAAAKFNEVVSSYPERTSADAALYWLGFVYKKQGRFGDADRALERLIENYANSTWIDDARAMRLEIAPRLGRVEYLSDQARSAATDRLRVVALQGLFEANPAEATELAAEIVRPDSKASRPLGQATISLLGLAGDERATRLLATVARDGRDAKLRRRAIYWLGQSKDASAFHVLRELAHQPRDSQEGEAAVLALSQLGNKGVWLTVKKGGRVLEISSGSIVSIDGAGKLSFKREGRLIEVPEGMTVTVDDQAVTGERGVRAGETVRIVAKNGKPMWEIRSAGTESFAFLDGGAAWGPGGGSFPFHFDGGSFQFGDDFAFTPGDPASSLFHVTPGGEFHVLPWAGGARLGVSLGAVDEALAAQLGIDAKGTIVITGVVAGTPAEKAGLKKFDIITHVNDKAPVTMRTLRDSLRDAKADEVLKLRVLRSKQPLDVTVRLAAPPRRTALDLPGAFPRDPSSVQLASGPHAELTIRNGKGEVVIHKLAGGFAAKANGQTVPEARLAREGMLLRVLDEAREPIMVVGVLENGALAYAASLDPFTLRGRLGVLTEPVTEALALQLGLEPGAALLVSDVRAASPAAKAGLRRFDVITRVDGLAPGPEARLDEAISRKRQGERVALTTVREGVAREVSVTLEAPTWPDAATLEARYRSASRRFAPFVWSPRARSR